MSWSAMWNRVIVQRQKGTIDSAGGTPPDWEDYIVGKDGTGVYAEIQQPNPNTAIIALAENIIITHTIKVRYDNRIKEDMRLKWWFEGLYHYAIIHTTTDQTYSQTWMLLDCREHTTQAESYT